VAAGLGPHRRLEADFVAGGAEPRRVIVTHRAGLPRIRGGTE
jgi:hypothetical protein